MQAHNFSAGEEDWTDKGLKWMNITGVKNRPDPDSLLKRGGIPSFTPSFIKIRAVREQHPRPHRKGVVTLHARMILRGKIRPGDQRLPVLGRCQLDYFAAFKVAK